MTASPSSLDPLVSVVIPTVGRWNLIRNAVLAAVTQRDVRVEVIVLADGPGSRDHGEIEALRHPLVRVIATPELDGVSTARNRGIDAATGTWIALLDDDDVWAPDKLALQIRAAEAAHADFAYASAAILGPDWRLKRFHRAPPADELSTVMIANNPIPAASSNLLVRTEVARSVRFDAELMHVADWDFAVGLILGYRGIDVADVLVGYLHHEGAMHYRQLESIEREFVYFRNKHRRRGLTLGGPMQSRWVAASYRESGRRRRAAYAYLRGAARYRSGSDLARAAGVLLGERAMWTVGGRHHPHDLGTAPEWVGRFVEAGARGQALDAKSRGLARDSRS